MKMLTLPALVLCLPLIGFAQQARKIFPYQYKINDLPNGLRLVTVPTDYPNLVALYVVVAAGSRKEVEPGRSGYAHFFEHLMFRGSRNFSADERDAILNGRPSPVTYTAPKPRDITEEDKPIEAFRINVRPDKVRIVPVEQVFE